MHSYPSLAQLKKSFIKEQIQEAKKAQIQNKKLHPSDKEYKLTMDKYCNLLATYFNSTRTTKQNAELKLQLDILKKYSKELNRLANELEKQIKLNSPSQIKIVSRELIWLIRG